MDNTLREDSRPLVAFYPEFETRRLMHSMFCHQFLPQYVHQNPFNFVRHDGTEPTRFLQARWMMMEDMIAIRRDGSLPTAMPQVFRRVTDISASEEVVAGHPCILVHMPAPEGPPCAFFLAAVLLTAVDPYRAAMQDLQRHILGHGPCPSDEVLQPFRSVPARVFTLERMPEPQGEDALKYGRFCEWTRKNEHRNSGRAIPATASVFLAAVVAALDQGEEIPAVACFKPGAKGTAPVLGISAGATATVPRTRPWWKFWS